MDKTKLKEIVCGCCGSTNILTEAYGFWSAERQAWQYEQVPYGHVSCEDCGSDSVEWISPEDVVPAKPLVTEPF